MKGETVKLISRTSSDTDPLGNPIYVDTEITVDDVLIGTPSTDAAVTDLNLHGKKLAFVLGIPKGDTHNWQDTFVLIRGEKYRTYGFPLLQTAENVPGRWNLQVKVERYE